MIVANPAPIEEIKRLFSPHKAHPNNKFYEGIRRWYIQYSFTASSKLPFQVIAGVFEGP